MVFVVHKGSAADTCLSNSDYKKINYGDMDADKVITSSDIRTVATYIAKGTTIESDSNAVVADIYTEGSNNGKISTRDLFEILKSLR